MSEPTHTHAVHHHGSAAIYVKTLIALLILTIITVAASYVDFGSGNVVIALFIATIKATLVSLFFMHLRWDKPVNAIIACCGFFFLGIFLMFDFIDFGTRDHLRPVNWDGKMPVEIAAPAVPGPSAPAEPEKK